ncbi:unnamed protein product [Menidia menidia]|uniref:(Atlantic silverside) hypothetical protein n=1 Tax=Menidia menidia TaxID=238744 RepID=A0A8S4BPM8_9TELE|nr:unnamed protein product [Menidia menidia]
MLDVDWGGVREEFHMGSIEGTGLLRTTGTEQKVKQTRAGHAACWDKWMHDCAVKRQRPE